MTFKMRSPALRCGGRDVNVWQQVSRCGDVLSFHHLIEQDLGERRVTISRICGSPYRAASSQLIFGHALLPRNKACVRPLVTRHDRVRTPLLSWLHALRSLMLSAVATPLPHALNLPPPFPVPGSRFGLPQRAGSPDGPHQRNCSGVPAPRRSGARFPARHRDRGPCLDGCESRLRCAPSDDD